MYNQKILEAIKRGKVEELEVLLNKITSLELSWNKIGNKGAKDLSSALEKNRTLTWLDLSRNKIGAAGAKDLSFALEKNSTLLSLDLRSNKIGAAGTKDLSSALEKNHTLISLDFRGNKIGDAGAKYLSSALEKNRTLTSLDLSRNKIGAAGAKDLSSALEKNSTLTLFLLWGNKIGDRGTEAKRRIKEILNRNNSLAERLIQQIKNNNFIGVGKLLSSGVSILAKDEKRPENTALHLLMQKNDDIKRMTYLRFSQLCKIVKNLYNQTPLNLVNLKKDDEVSKSSFELPSELFKLSRLSLQELNFTRAWSTWCKEGFKNSHVFDLSNSNIRVSQLKIIKDLLLLCPIFKELNLSSNNFAIEEFELLGTLCGDLLKSNKVLQRIDLSNNNLDDDFIQYLSEGLQVNTSLMHLNFSRNLITYEGAKLLIKSTRNNERLKEINLSYNHTDVGPTFFKKMCKPKKHTSQSFEVNISMNYLGHKCKDLLKNHGIFRTQAGISKGIIVAKKEVTKNNWLVFMLRDKAGDDQHAMIIIEGIRDYGQQFIEMHDFRPISGILPKRAKVNTTYYNPEKTLRRVDGYQYTCYPMSAIRAKKLQRFINTDKEKMLGYSKSGKATKSSLRTYNCLTWVIAKLQEIGLNVKNPVFVAVPSLYILGRKIKESTERTRDLIM